LDSKRTLKKSGRGGLLPVPFLRHLTTAAAAAVLLGGTAAAAQTTTGTSQARTLLDDLLSFLYSLGHLIGQGIVELIHKILPSLPFPAELVDPIGILAILTIFLILVSLARKLAWILVIVGWVLIVVRIILVVVNSRL